MKSEARLPASPAEFTGIAKSKSELLRRRSQIRKEGLETCEHTEGCPGRSAVKSGRTAMNRAEERRERVAEELEKVGDERLEGDNQKLLEHLEEEENGKERAKTSEGSVDSKVFDRQRTRDVRRRSTETQGTNSG